jgi:uncharacterized repeat protein (TIGR03803 family)
LIQGTDGNFYGTTYSGGSANTGTVFSLTGPAAPTLTWSAVDIAADINGTSRVLWNRTDGAAGIWNVDPTGAVTAIGAVYGPYTDSEGTWTAKKLTVAADGRTRVLWTRADGAAGLWTLDAYGTEKRIGAIYGPYADTQGTWTAADFATAPNGQSRILWTRSDGAIGLWTMNPEDDLTSIGGVYGPIAGWTAKADGATGDGTARVLWTKADGEMGLWTMDAANAMQTVGTVYGPFTDSGGLWSAVGLGTSAGGGSQVLWTRADGAAGLWTFDGTDQAATIGAVYGPFTGLTATASDAASSQARVLWVRSDRAMEIWNFDESDSGSFMNFIYGPF